MDNATIAKKVLDAVGGCGNIVSNSVCMTRLRLTLLDPSKVDSDSINSIHSVLGLTRRGEAGIEVVFGPSAINGVAQEFSRLTGHGMGLSGQKGTFGGTEVADDPLRVEINAATYREGSRPPQMTPRASAASASDDITIDDILHSEDNDTADGALSPNEPLVASTVSSRGNGPRALIINGPNINMLGIREPAIYGREDYASLVALCHTAGQKAGFSEVTCFQSNHEGDLVDEIQAAWKVYDGIVINPGGLTHTSVSILDAIKAVDIPAVEVHVSKVDEREEFRQVSYVRAACFETVIGMGIQGYAKALTDLAEHLSGASRIEQSS